MLKRLFFLIAPLLAVTACTTSEPSASDPPPSDPPATSGPAPAEPPASTSVTAAPAGAIAESSGEILDGVFAALDENGFTGIVMVKDGDDLDFTGFGLADREAGAEWDADTVFTVGSITKQFTGAAIVKLEMEGRLSVDDTLGEHVPYATGELADVTLHELLTHTAGLPGGLGDDFAPVSRREIVELGSAAIENRGEFNYSNPGYSMLGVVIEEITGLSYEEYLRSVFFLPLGMINTGYVLPDWSNDVVAVGYDGSVTWGRPNEQPWDTDGPYWHLRANGGILSTGTDMMRWHEALLGNEILDDDAKAKLFARHVAEGAEGGPWSYGYGWTNVELADGATLITHNGGNGIFFADFLRFIDDDLTILIATNVAGADEDAAFRIGDALLGTEMAGPVTDSCVPDDIAGLELIDGFPDGPAGSAVEGMFLAVTTGDEAQRRAFAEAHIPGYLAQGMTPDQVAAELLLIREEFAPFTFREVRKSSESTFHVVMAGTPDTEGDAVISVALNPDDDNEIACIDLGFGY